MSNSHDCSKKKLGLNIELDGSTWKTALDRAFKYEVDGIMNVAELEERKLGIKKP